MELETQVKWGEWWRDELAWQGKELAKVANKISLLCFSGDSTTSWDHFKTLPMSSSLPPPLCLQTLLYSCYGQIMSPLGRRRVGHVHLIQQPCSPQFEFAEPGHPQQPVFILPAATKVHCDVLSPAMPISSCQENMIARSIQESAWKTACNQYEYSETQWLKPKLKFWVSIMTWIGHSFQYHDLCSCSPRVWHLSSLLVFHRTNSEQAHAATQLCLPIRTQTFTLTPAGLGRKSEG